MGDGQTIANDYRDDRERDVLRRVGPPSLAAPIDAAYTIATMYMPKPKSLADAVHVLQRLDLLETEPSVQQLRAWSADLAARRSATVPHFDPAEGGVNVRVLLVQEAPGPMTNPDGKRPGSGFISVDNNDETAAMVWRAREEVGLHTGMLSWNIVPWYLGVASVKPSAVELEAGAIELRRLMVLLPQLEVVITSGLYAQKGWSKYIAPHASRDITVISTWHPSPLAMKQPGKRDELRRAYERAARLIGGQPGRKILDRGSRGR